MHLLRSCDTSEFNLFQFDDGVVPSYAILSHTWGRDTEEVTFEDLINGTGKNKLGYEKIRFCGAQAAQDGLEWFWIDTCCINKTNKAELSQAISSMFRWYCNATRCYVYLSDMSTPVLRSNKRMRFTKHISWPFNWVTTEEAGNGSFNPLLWESDFRKSKCFTRGWTLQELLGPVSVEFFSQEWRRLGDKSSLEQLIHEITGIPKTALQGTPLSQFSVKDRFRWIGSRQTKLEEDKAYSLMGIFDIDIPLRYGEGMASAFKRLEAEINKLSTCIQDLRLTDPYDDKKRIEETKGGLLEDSYSWILKTSDFQQWRTDKQSRLLWIKGDPGKGKTMLLCGIINELTRSMAKTDLLSYFFCQAADSQISNATAVLRGLLYMLVKQQPSLVSHIRKKHDHAGKALFEDANAWVAFSDIFTDILRDSNLNNTYLVIDALDECVTDLPKLLDFIVQNSSVSHRVKWIISSRNEAYIEQRLRLDNSGTRLSLELKENTAQVARAVVAYIDHCLSELPEIQHNTLFRDSVRKKMQQKANGTFLWVSLVIKELKNVMTWDVLRVLDEVPTELKELYRRMINQIKQLQRQYPELCRQVLSTIIAAYRPLHLQELFVLCDLPSGVSDVNQTTTTIVKMCGSFLTIAEGYIYIIHQSAREFLSNEASHDIFPHGIGDVHQSLFSKSLQVMSGTLRRDMYNLRTPGYLIQRVTQPDPDPLVATRYSCVYWVDHLLSLAGGMTQMPLLNEQSKFQGNLHNYDAVYTFLKQKYLYWLEALSLCKSMSKGVISMTKLEAFTQVILAWAMVSIYKRADIPREEKVGPI
jgi:hypothetical protein